MTSRVVSFAWGRGLGHVSRLIAVHCALRDLGWDSLFLVQREQRLLDEYQFSQVVIPTDEESLVGEPFLVAQGKGNRTLARLIVAGILSDDDIVVHDVVVQRELYEQATRLGCRQMLIHRFHKNRSDPGAWVARTAPSIEHVYLLGRPGYAAMRGKVHVKGVHDVMRQPLAEQSVWSPDAPAPRIVVTAGGGGHLDAGGFLTSALEAIARVGRRDARLTSVYVVTGPNFLGQFSIPPHMHASIQVTPYIGPRYSLYQDTTALITHCGYNTVQELAHTGVPAVVVPGVRHFDDQHKHLEAASDRLDVVVAGATPESIAQGLASVLGRGMRRPNVGTPPRGAWEIAHDLTRICTVTSHIEGSADIGRQPLS